jgi:nucleotide-binding universal stress UspA family protein
MPQKVLIPVGGSSVATAALEHALSILGNGEITALHVIEADEPGGGIRERALPRTTQEHHEAAVEDADRVLAAARRRAAADGETLTTAAAYGSPIREIVDYAERNGFDRIVVGSHDRSGVSRLLLGSVAEGVARRSTIPVTVVSEPDESGVEVRSEPGDAA